MFINISSFEAKRAAFPGHVSSLDVRFHFLPSMLQQGGKWSGGGGVKEVNKGKWLYIKS